MNTSLASDYMINVQVFLHLFATNKISVTDAARQIHFFTFHCPDARSLVATGSAIDIQLKTIEERNKKIGFDLYRITSITFEETVNGTNRQSLRIDSFGQATVTDDQTTDTGVIIWSEALSRFAMASQLIEQLVDHDWLWEFVDDNPKGDLVAFFINIRVDEDEHRIGRWVYREQSKSPPQEITQLIDYAHETIVLVRSKYNKGAPR